MQTLPTIDSPSETIAVSVFGSPFSEECENCVVPAGQTLYDIIGLDEPLEHNEIVVMHGDKIVPQRMWKNYKPKAGTQLIIGLLPKDNNILALAATVALAVFSGPLAGLINTTLFGGVLAEGGLLLLQAGIIFGGTLLINHLFGPDEFDEQSTPDVYSINGIRNTLPSRTQPIIALYGEHRVYPFFAAQPYTETSGIETQYLHLLFDLGYGPLEIVDDSLLKIGEQPFSAFTGLTWEFHDGMPGEDSEVSSIYTNQHFTETFSIKLTKMNDWQTVLSYPNCNKMTVNIFFAGLFQLNDDGDRVHRTVEFEYQTRALNAGAWSGSQTLSIRQDKTSTVFTKVEHTFSSRGQHAIRIRRTTDDTTDNKIRDEAVMYSVVSSNPDKPVNVQGRALFALRIQATDQLSGAVDTFSGVFRRKVQTFDGATWSDTYTGSSSVAWAYVDILRGQGLYNPIPNADIDGAAFKAWDEYCTRMGYRFDGIINNRQSVWDVLKTIALCGRGSPELRDGHLHSIIIDQVKTTPVDLLTPRDDLEFQGAKAFVDPPHGVTISFRDRSDNLYIPKEITVYDTGYTAANARDIRRIPGFGTSDTTNAHRRAKYALAQSRLRPEEFEILMDVKHLAVTRGDYVDLLHDIPLIGVGQGRVNRAVISGGEWVGFDTDDTIPEVTDASARLNARFQTFEGTQILTEVIRNPTPRPQRTASSALQRIT